MPFSGDRNVSYAVEFGPGIQPGIVHPHIVEPFDAVGTAKPSSWVSRKLAHHIHNLKKKMRIAVQVHLVLPGDNGMIGSSGRSDAAGYSGVARIGYQDLPAAGRRLKGIQVERDQVIEEESLYLTTKDKDLRT